MIQDVGRPGYLATGVPPSGAADRFALGIGNLLVGNDPGERYLVGRHPGDAGVEILLLGLKLEVLKETVVAVTGADLTPTLSGAPLAMWRATRVGPGDIILFQRPRAGARAYLTVAGGVDVPPFEGSRATNLRAFIGGVGGRALRKGDVLRTFPPRRPFETLGGRRLKPELVLTYGKRRAVRVVLGPQDDLFQADSHRHLPQP